MAVFEDRGVAPERDYLFVLIPGLIWGASFLFIAEGLRAIGPNGVAFVRILIGFSTLSLFPTFPLTLVPHAEQRVSSAITGMLNSSVPLFAALVATLMARQLPPRGGQSRRCRSSVSSRSARSAPA